MTTFYEKLSLENYFGPSHHHRYNHHRILNEAATAVAAAATTGSSSLSTSSSASSSTAAAATAIVIDKAVHNLPFELTTTAGGSLTKFNYVPAIVPIPTIRADDRELAFKKYMTAQQKYLGIGATSFSILLFTLLTLLITSCAIFGFITYNFLIDEDHMFEWKLFGIVVSSTAILVTLAIVVFVLVYSRSRHEKYKRALRVELDTTDENGHTVRMASLSRIYRQYFSTSSCINNNNKNSNDTAHLTPSTTTTTGCNKLNGAVTSGSGSIKALVGSGSEKKSNHNHLRHAIRQQQHAEVSSDEASPPHRHSTSSSNHGSGGFTKQSSQRQFRDTTSVVVAAKQNRITPVENLY